jgi:multiphosphoryl transfer protein
MSRVTLVSPLTGWCLALAEVADPVFAQRMAGDGLAVDPALGEVRAPCDGEIVSMKDAKHAVTVRAQGIDILVHVGLDTVALGGAGFERLVEGGRRVRAGETLLRFDLDWLARHARSLASPIVVAAGGSIVRRAGAGPIAAGDFLLEIEPIAAARRAGPTHATAVRAFVVPFEHGLHVRPAAQVASALRPFAADVTIVAHGRSANARSPVAMMGLAVRCGDEVEARASGVDAAQALAALEGLFTRPVSRTAASRSAPPADPGRIEAVIASRGLAMGPCVPWSLPEIPVAERGTGPAPEAAALDKALGALGAHLEGLRATAKGEGAALLGAHIELARDPDLLAQAHAHLDRGHSAGYAWRQATRATSESLRALDDPRLRERASDLRDLEQQVLRILAGEPPSAERAFPPGAIVVAEDLLPSQLMALERSGVRGVCTAAGGATSHMAILAAAAGLPALVAAGHAILAIAEGTTLVVDAEAGFLHVDPPALERSAIERALSQRTAERAADRRSAREPASTADGVRIAVKANLGSFAEAAEAVALGAEGCGLLRTEFLFLDRREPPSEDEQAAEYQRIADALGGRPLAIRTMDIGGDKPIAYMPLAHEDNPALGLRGVRSSLEYPEILRAQLRAILRVRPVAACRILLPMVTDVADIRHVRALIDEAARELGVGEPPALGAMVETPASALLARALAAECDFLSIGTNDLSQYALAIDRGHARLAGRLDALHPAVLRLIAMVADAAREGGKTASVCGALASDSDALPVLVGLGIHEISATAAAIPRLKRIVRTLDASECRELAHRALDCATAAEVRASLT